MFDVSRPGRLAVETALAEIEVVAHLALESGTAQRALSASITRHAGVETRHNFHLALKARPIAWRDHWLGSPPRLNVDQSALFTLHWEVNRYVPSIWTEGRDDSDRVVVDRTPLVLGSRYASLHPHTVTNFQGKRRVSANTTCAEENIYVLK